MPSLDTCPRCRAERLAVVYFDANDEPIGGHIQCPDCGPRHSEELSFDSESVRETLLERRAS
jgi:transcription elongation factor Elf1